MKSIMFVNQKGGVGKSTLAVNTSLFLSNSGKVQVYDCDPQCSLVYFFQKREENNLDVNNIELDCPQIRFLDKKLKNIQQDPSFKYTVIDTQGSANAEITEILTKECIDMVIIPVQPSMFDINASIELLKKIVELKNQGINIQYKVLINGAMTNSKATTQEIKNLLLESNIPHFDHVISYRKIYKDAIIDGKGMFETNSDKSNIENAINEFNQFINELKQDLGE